MRRSTQNKMISLPPLADPEMDHLFFASFHVAGFSYYEGAFLFPELQVGSRIELRLDHENIYDDHAVELRFKGNKIGYVPQDENAEISTILKAGYNIFVAVVQQISPAEHPERQVRVGVFVTRNKSFAFKGQG